MRGPLAVRIDDGTTVRHVTRRTRGLRFSRTAFGGDADLACMVSLPRHAFRHLGAGAELVVYDTRTGGVVWSGHIDHPGTSASRAGQEFVLQAFGGAQRLKAATTPLGYAVKDLSLWERSSNSQKGAKTRPDERADERPTIQIYANDGKSVTTGFRGEYVIRALKRAGLEVGWVSTMRDSGRNDADYRVRLLTGTDLGSLSILRDQDASTTSAQMSVALDNVLPTGQTIAALRIDRVNTARTATDDDWHEFFDIAVAQTRLDLSGARVTSDYTGGVIYAHEVITDMLGRGMAPGADTSQATVDETFTYPIDALDWLDGVTMADGLAELLIFEPDLWWTLYGDRFTAGRWDEANPRYVISARDGGISKPDREYPDCNRVHVTWVDERGRERPYTFDILNDSADLAAYEAAGYTAPNLNYTRDAEPITLPAGLGSAGNAERVAIHALGMANNPPPAGTAVVRREVRDAWGGRRVMPHELMPGCAVLEQETGQTYWLTGVEYVDAEGAAVLTLGEPPRTTEQIIARVARRKRRRR